jgi:hypothetical protein
MKYEWGNNFKERYQGLHSPERDSDVSQIPASPLPEALRVYFFRLDFPQFGVK